MAEKELRKMNRTELIEIIYALQQNEKQLRQKNEDLSSQLDDRLIRLEQAGSMAEAALSLNHVFEDAQKASEQYLKSLAYADAQAEEQAGRILEEARTMREQMLEETRTQREQILEEARTQQEQMLEEAQRQSEEILEEVRAERDKTRKECRQLLVETKRQIKKREEKFVQDIWTILNKYPELKEYIRSEKKAGGTGA